MWTTPARKPTGTYLAPGTIATVTVPPALVNAGYKVRVGCHSWDLETRTPVKRLERATSLYPITSTTTKVANPYGGGIYIEVPFRSSAGVVSVTVTGAVRAPYFSKKTFHTTTPAEWLVERTHLAPWADFQTDKYMTQVPRKWIYNFPDPTQAMTDWDLAMDAVNDLMGFPRTRGKESLYAQADIILRSSVHAPGYPATNQTGGPNAESSPLGYAGTYLIRGPGVSLTATNIEIHEQGHGYGFPKFGGESESTVNLLQGAIQNRALGKTIDEAQNGTFGSGNSFITVDNTAVAWMCVFNFSPREVPMAQGEKAYQHKGHAKFMDIARLFGWTGMDNFWKSFMQDDANGISYGSGTDDLLLRLSRHVGKDIRPLLHFWGIHPQNPGTLAAAIAAENIPASVEIRDQLLHYKNIVPADNAAFRTFALGWWGRQPTINGAWEEREHARQWDTMPLYSAGDQQRSQATNPGEIFNENSANDIRNRVQELLDLYYPSSITPATQTFAVAPAVGDSTTVGMVATTAVAAIGPMQYSFDETSGNPGGTDSGWQNSPVYQDSGLTPGLTYTYTVTARDGLGNLNTVSASLNATPTAAGDITAPAPSPMTFATAPTAVDESSITMTAANAIDISGVEYYFENITNSTNSGWQDSPAYTEINLLPSTPYAFRVRARDKSANQNATAFSDPANASTEDPPDLTPPQIVSVSPADGSLFSNLAADLVATFDEPVVTGSGSVTLKNLTDATETVFAAGSSAILVSGNTMTINPPTNLVHGKIYAIQMSTGLVADTSNNPFQGINDNDTWNFTTILGDPLAVTGGPYVVPLGTSLTLNGSASEPSYGQTLVTYEWDLNNDGNFGDATEASPAAISDAELAGIWGMALGQNTIALRVTDSIGKTGTVTTTVKLGFSLLWDANGATAGHTDGAGGWLNANQWRDDGVNTGWISGAAAIFGNGGTGGAVTLASPTTVGSLTLNPFTGNYTLGSASNVLTLNKGITKASGSGTASIVSPVALAGSQTWANNSVSDISATAGLTTGGHTLAISGSGNVNFAYTGNVISGSGGITMNGPGRLILGSSQAPAHTYSGTTTINGGNILVSNNLTGGNLTLNGGFLDFYYGGSMTRALGSGAGQVQILGGTSGFSQNANGQSATIRFSNSSTTEVVWGSSFFNPSTLLLLASNAQGTAGVTFDNKLDLNGANRTITTAATTTGAGSATIAQIIRNSHATAAGLIKTGSGRLNLNAANTYNGGTTIQAGTLQLGNATALGPVASPLTVNGGLLNLNDQTVSVGNLSGTGGTIANNASGARTFTIGSGNATGGIYQGVIANKTGAGTGTVAVTKTGSGTLTLAGANTYTGATTINGGTLVMTGGTQATTSITFANNSLLNFVIGSPVTAAGAAVNFANGRIAITGLPVGQGQALLTAASFTGTPVLVGSFPNYELVVIGNQLWINSLTDQTPPSVVNITDDTVGGSIVEGNPIIFTVTFSEDMDAATVDATDFGNAGTAAGSIGAVTETSPGVFTVPVLPTTLGTFQLRINSGAVLQDLAGNSLDNDPVIVDNTVVAVTRFNTAPVAAAQSVGTDEDVALPVTLTGTDAELDPLAFVIVAQPANGTLSGTAPNLTYTPAANFNGADGFTFRVNDGFVDSAEVAVSITVAAVNDVPVAIAQNLTTPEDSALPITLAGTDVENSPLTYTIVAQPANGSLTGTPPNLTYTPTANFYGAVSLTFTVNDGTVSSALATVSINVTSVNDVPVAVARTLTTVENAPLPITLSGSDVDLDTLAYAIVTQPANGTLSGTPPNVTYMPAAGFDGSDSFTFKVNDGTVDSVPATVGITITPGVSLTWDATAGGAINDGGAAWLGSGLWNNAGTPSATWVSGAAAAFGNGGAGGAVTLASPTTAATMNFNSYTGTYTVGTAANAITLNNGIVKNSGSGTATIVSPVILGWAQTWTNNSTNALNLSGGLNTGGHTLTFGGSGTTNLNATANIITGSGGITLSGPGRLVLGANPAPVHTYSGTTTINGGSVMINGNLGTGPLVINDGYLDFYFGGTFSRSLGTGSGQVQILGNTSGFSNNGATGATVRLNNNAAYEVVWGTATFNPSALLLQASTAQGTSSLVFDNKLDLNGANRTINTAATTTGAGSATIAQIIRNSQAAPAGLIKTGSGRLNLNGANTYNGGTTVQSGTLQLGNAAALGSVSGMITVNGGVLNLNDQTVFVGNLAGTGGTIANNGSSARTLTIGSGNTGGGIYQGVIVNKTGTGTGSVALTKVGNGTITLANSNTYTGATGIVGGTLIITGNTQATASITFANNSSLGLDIASPVTAAAAAVNLANGLIAVYGTPSGASHLLLTAASITGSPVLTTAIPGYELVVSGNQLFLNSTPPPDVIPPTLVGITDDAGGASVLVSTLINYTVTFDEDINAATVTAADFGNSGTAALAIGTVIETTPGAFIVQATPTSTGTLQLRINAGSVINDVAGNSLNTATAIDDETIISVTPLNTAPVADSQSVSTAEDIAMFVTLTATDGQSDPLNYVIIDAPLHGTLSGSAPNLTYTPAANYQGPDAFTFVANDGLLDSSLATVDITITPVNDAPAALGQNLGTTEDTALPVTLVGTDIENSPLTYTIVFPPANGTLSGTPPNVTYTPSANYNGADGFTFTVNDGAVESEPAAVLLTVTPINDMPVAIAQSVTTAEDTALPVTLTGTDVDLDALTYTIVTPPVNGTLSGTPPNMIYTPTANSNGADSFTFTVSDGFPGSALASVSITVTAVNDVPVAVAQNVTTAEDTALPITLAGTDVENSALTYTIVSPPANGTLSGTASNILYTPAANSNGSDGFIFTVNDGTTDSSPATVSITVTPVNDAPVAVALIFIHKSAGLAGLSDGR